MEKLSLTMSTEVGTNRSHLSIGARIPALDFVFMMETRRKGQGGSNRSSDGFLRDGLGCGSTVASSGGLLPGLECAPNMGGLDPYIPTSETTAGAWAFVAKGLGYGSRAPSA